MKIMRPFILASASPRRQELIRLIVPDTQVIPANVDEHIQEEIPVSQRPVYLAERKGAAVSHLYPDACVLGCDTSVIIEDTILGKPENQEDAYRMLRLLSGKSHTVITGCALFCCGLCHRFSVETQVEFYQLCDEEIEEYIRTGEPMDKAGAYGIQGKGILLVKGIRGDYSNVVGLPIPVLKRELEFFIKKAGI